MTLKYEPEDFETTPNDWYRMPDYGRNSRAINAIVSLNWFRERGEVISWRKQLKKGSNWELRQAVIKNGELNNLTDDFKQTLKKALEPPFNAQIVTYGLPGKGKSKFVSKVAAFVKKCYPEYVFVNVTKINDVLTALDHYDERTIIMCDENTRAMGTGSNKEKWSLSNLLEQARKYGDTLFVELKTWRNVYLANYYLQMFGFNTKTGESRAIWYDQDLRSLGVIVFQESGDEVFYEMFEKEKDLAFDQLKHNRGELPAYSGYDIEMVAQTALQCIENHPELEIKPNKSEMTDFLTSKEFTEVYTSMVPDAIRGKVANAVIKHLRTIQTEKKHKAKEDAKTAINPTAIDQAVERLIADPAYTKIKSVIHIISFLRAHCTDIIPLDQVGAAAPLIFYKRKEIREKSLNELQQRSEGMKANPNYRIVEQHNRPDYLTPLREQLKEGGVPFNEVRTFQLKCAHQGNDDVALQLKHEGLKGSSGSVSNWITDIQQNYLGYAFEKVIDHELTREGIPHITGGGNTSDIDQIIFEDTACKIPKEVRSVKCYCVMDIYHAVSNVSDNEKTYAKEHQIPCFCYAYECFTQILRIIVLDLTSDQSINQSNFSETENSEGIDLTTPHPLVYEAAQRVGEMVASYLERRATDPAPIAKVATEAGSGQKKEKSKRRRRQ